MENVNRWYFTKEQLANTPSRKFDIDPTRELSYRQQAANFIQDMGQRLQLSQLCINTAIVYMHRFYVFHSFTEVHRNKLSISALFLAAKVEEQPRKLEHVIKVGHACLHKDAPQLDVRSEAYAEKMTEVAAHENVLLQTLGFVLAIEHPHTYVVKVCQLVKASKDLAQTSYIMATTSLHMTTMCLQYKPTVVACVCIHLACKWSSYMIEPCSEGRDWFYYVDRSVTWELLESLTQEFIAILETSPHRFKRKFGKDAGGYPGPKNLLPLENAEIADSPDKPSTSSHPTAVPQPCASSQAQASSQPVFQPPTSTLPTAQPSLTTQPSAPPQVPAPVVSSSSAPQPSQPLVNSHSSGELPQENAHKPSPVTKDVKTNGSKETELLEKKPPTSNEHVSSKKSSEQSSSKHERREKRKHSSHSSKDKVSSSNHSEQTTGIKVKIRKDIINLSGVESSSQKYVPPVKLETQSPKTSIKIKIPKPPPMVETPKVEKEKPVTPASLKIVLTKDKSGSGSYSTSHKNERESRKRSHNSGTPQGIYKNSHESSMKYVKVEHQFQKNHSGDMRHNKVSRHSSHRSGMDSTPNNVSSARLPHPVGSENSTFQNYQPVPNYQNYPFQLTPPPPPPKLRGHGMLVGKTNSGLPAQPPLPPPQPPPPPPPPE